jgi:hypothetical protein
MTPEYTAEQARRDAQILALRRLCAVLWDAACDADPTIRSHRVGWRREPQEAA